MPLKSMMGLGLAALFLSTGCGTPASTPEASSQPGPAAGPKHATLAFAGNPAALANRFAVGAAGGTGVANLEALLNRGLSITDSQGNRQPQMATAVPTVDNGSWKLLPDGRMETTWKLRPNARWQDGTAFTSADLRFTAQVEQDKDLPFQIAAIYRSIESLDAPDPLTLTVKWKNPYIRADAFLEAAPLPKHLLEGAYVEEKTGLAQASYWTDSYVGTGPYRLQEWSRGAYVLLNANPDFALGAPKIDELEVRFIPDLNTLMANALADTVDVTLGGATLSIDQAVQVRDQWRDGRVDIGVNGWIAAFPQMLNPKPAGLGDLQFRRALLQALDRQQMADGIQFGLTPVAHFSISSAESEYRDVERSAVRYDYDPRRAAEMIEQLGFTKGADGFYRDAAGQPLEMEVRCTATYDVAVKAMTAAADFWQRVGIRVEQSPTPQQLQGDREYRANFPAFNVQRQPADADSVSRYVSSEAARPETNYQGESKNRYMSPELDGLIEKYFLTIPRPDRMGVLGQIVHHMTDQVVVLGLFYDSAPSLIASRLVNVPTSAAHANVYEWDVR